MKYSICYRIITPESAENGEFSDQGFETENEISPLRDIIHAARSLGITARSDNDLTGWWESIDPERDYQTGEEKFYSLHIPKVKHGSRNFRIINNALRS
jgi:hypothetical protein